MKINTLIFLIVLPLSIFAQIFVEAPQYNTFEEVRGATPIFADIDGDSDQDMFVYAENSSKNKIYLNDGAANFTLAANTPFTELIINAASFGDVDNDGDQDLVLAIGAWSAVSRMVKVYINNGNGIFTELPDTSLVGMKKCALALADLDGDDDLDIFITGAISPFEPIADVKMYFNDGNANFTEVSTGVIPALGYASVAVADINGDMANDLLISGENESGDYFLFFYNNGQGEFVIAPDTFGRIINYEFFELADIDGDDDLDMLVMAEDPLAWFVKLYLNDGTGHFEESTQVSFDRIGDGDIGFSDFDEDGDLDLLIMGETPSSGALTLLYLNDGTGVFSEAPETNLVPSTSSFAIVDLNGSGHQDLFILPRTYLNDGTGHFNEYEITPTFENVSDSGIAFADVDGDNDQDAFITGNNGTNQGRQADLYLNNGVESFTKVTGMPFAEVDHSTVDFADVDLDGDQDIILAGETDTGYTINLYINDGNGQYTEQLDVPFAGMNGASAAFVDVNEDSYPDIFAVELNEFYIETTKLYINDGSGSFVEQDNPFMAAYRLAYDFTDVDGDGDQDVLMLGNITTKLYTNDGTGNFSEVSGSAFAQLSVGTVNFADIDGDGDQDVLLTGNTNFDHIKVAVLYENNGLGNFTEVSDSPFTGVNYSDVAFADVDLDDDQDVLIMGLNRFQEPIINLYLNDGEGNFVEESNTPFPELEAGDIDFADVDGDNDPDLLLTGRESFHTMGRTILYLNTSSILSSQYNPVPTKTLDFILFPNPSNTPTVNIAYHSDRDTQVDITMYDWMGHLLRNQQQDVLSGEQVFSLDVSSLPQGSYLVILNDGQHQGVARLLKH